MIKLSLSPQLLERAALLAKQKGKTQQSFLFELGKNKRRANLAIEREGLPTYYAAAQHGDETVEDAWMDLKPYFPKTKLKKQGNYEMDLFDRFIERTKLSAEAVKPVKATPAKPTAKPANAKPASASGKPGAAGPADPNAKIDPVTGKPMFEGVKFNAGLKTEKDETKVMVQTTNPKADLKFKDLARTFVDKVNIGEAKDKK